MMKLLSVVLIVFSTNSFADDFQDRKSKWSNNLESKIAELQKTKSCVDGAKDHDALKQCRKDRKEKLKEVRTERKERFKNKKAKNKKS